MDSELSIGSIPMTVQGLKEEVEEMESDMEIDEADLMDNLSMEDDVEDKKSEKAIASQAESKSVKSPEKKQKAPASQEDIEEELSEDE